MARFLQASGPPGFRLRELLALSRAGVVRFPGAGLRVGTNEDSGTFTASSPTVPGHTVTATALIEAYLPGPSLGRSEDPLLRGLHGAGALSEEVISDSTHTHRSGLLTVTTDGASHVVDPRWAALIPAGSRSAPRRTSAASPPSPVPAPTPRPSGRTTPWPGPC